MHAADRQLYACIAFESPTARFYFTLHRDINGAEQFRNVVIQENYLSGVAVSKR